jgi:hypothetical protein
VPIACSLTPDAADFRRDEWRHLLAASTHAVERTSAEQVRVRLAAADVAAAVELAQREKACCPFFDFSIDITVEAIWLSIGVPAEASSVLDDMARLLAEAP